MNILYVGDITGKLGRQTVHELLPGIVEEYKVDLVIAQGENTSHGRGLQANHASELRNAGVDFFTGGNHSMSRTDYLREAPDAIRPANLPKDSAGKGYGYAKTAFGNVLVISLLGKIVGMDAEKEIQNPLEVVDAILHAEQAAGKAATIVNFHGDYSSEKVVIGQYLDGRVSAVIGDHWHVPTADAQVLPKGTAHLTDVGMTGALDSSLGVKTDIIVQRWRDPDARVRNEMEEQGRRQFNAAMVEVNPATGLASSIVPIRRVLG